MQPYNAAAERLSPHHQSFFSRYRHTLFIVLSVFLVLLIGGSTYAVINLTAQKPVQHSSLKPGVNIDQGEKGLVGWWKLNGNAKDSTPYQDNGTLSSPPPTPTADRKATANGAYSFNGTSNYIEMPTGNNGILSITGNMTINAWVNIANNNNYEPIVSKSNSPGSTGEYEMAADFRSGSTSLSWRSTNANSTAFTNFFAGYTGQWVQVTAVVSGTNLSVYRNGQFFGSQSIGTRSASSNDVVIGSRPLNKIFLFQGSISDVRIYNRALSQQDITNLYNSYNSQINLYSPPGAGNGVNLTAGLVGYWPFNGNAKDATPFSHNGTVINATLTSDRAGRPNSAYHVEQANRAEIQVAGGPVVSANATIAGWFYLPSGNSGGPGGANDSVLLRDNTCASGWILGYLPDGDSGHFSFRTGGAIFNTSVLAASIENRWAYYVMTVSGNVAKYYLDGALVYTGATNVPTASALPWHFMENGSCGQYEAASASDIRIYDRAINAAEVQALYNLPN
ncbi:MAG TPA: LamG domain-containing protein [Candidatus Saccharimonadales bacterium]|nr:LamG domain-containing protein [Candidatus Saccharimonadales bacterium]